jgi:hypothetical protein
MDALDRGILRRLQQDGRQTNRTFRFALQPGQYVIAGHYDLDQGRGYYTFKEVTVTAGGVLRVDLPNSCM